MRLRCVLAPNCLLRPLSSQRLVSWKQLSLASLQGNPPLGLKLKGQGKAGANQDGLESFMS
jgi:hypothetical protein